MLSEVAELQMHLDHMKKVIHEQHTKAHGTVLAESLQADDLIDDVLSMTRPLQQPHNIPILLDIAPSLPAIESDRHQIIQILVNLLKNALEALIADPVDAPQIRLSVQAEGTDVCFQVADNGRGIPEDVKTKIFQFGFTTKEDGNGFGLHSCSNMASQLGGQLQLLERDDHSPWTIFELKIPSARRTAGDSDWVRSHSEATQLDDQVTI